MNFMEKIINYDAKKFLAFIFSIHCAFIGSIALDLMNVQIPVLRQVIGFIYLTFVPGIVMHRVFKLRKLALIESIIYIIGLSVLFIMFTGFFMNKLSVFLVQAPISAIPLASIMSMILLALSLLCYMRDKNASDNVYSDVTKNSSNVSLLFLCTIPLLSIFGSYFVNYYHTNILLTLCIIFILIVVILIIFTNMIPEYLYPFSIFIVSISLLYHNSLSSTFLDGWDIQYEYYFSNLVLINSSWDSSIPSNVNAMLSIIMLAPIYSEICNLDLTYVFKIIFPFIFSMVPIGAYYIYQKQVPNKKIAFLSVFYFVSISTFYTEMLALARQQIGELFLVLIFIAMLSNLELFKKRMLIVLFVLGLIISHYGLSYLTLLFLPLGYLFMNYRLKYKSDTYTASFILLFFVFASIWYLNFTEGSIFGTVVQMFSHIYESIIEEFFATKSTQLVTGSSPFLSSKILKVLYLVSQFFIVIGFIKISTKPGDFRISNEYLSFSFALICALISAFLTSSTGMNIHRLYHITSIFLSIFCVIGGITVFRSLFNVLDKKQSTRSLENPLKILSVFFVIFMIFNIGLGQQLLHDNPVSVSINRGWIEKSDNLDHKSFLYKMHFPLQDVISTKWLSKNKNAQARIYADYSSTELLLYSYGMIPYEIVLTNKTITMPDSYVYLRYPNVRYGMMYGSEKNTKWNVTDILPSLSRKNLIYSNHDSVIYMS